MDDVSQEWNKFVHKVQKVIAERPAEAPVAFLSVAGDDSGSVAVHCVSYGMQSVYLIPIIGYLAERLEQTAPPELAEECAALRDTFHMLFQSSCDTADITKGLQ